MAWPLLVTWWLTVGLVLLGEWQSWSTAAGRTERLTGWFCGLQPDWLPFLPWLLLGMLLWFGRRSPSSNGVRQSRWQSWFAAFPSTPSGTGDRILTAVAGMGVLAIACVMSWWVGESFEDLPPAYHDEYSYLFQAETYLNGRLSFPSFAPRPQLFDQVHVLNEGRFASRYFPGVGIWIVPFLAAGIPILGHQLAQGLTALFVFLAGRELSGNGVGLLAGLLIAVSPGLLIFSNLFLAHHPTLVALMAFVWLFCLSQRTGSRLATLLAGGSLAFAMLCRPMTAAGVSLPFGLLFGWWWITGRACCGVGEHATEDSSLRFGSRTTSAVLLGGPLVLGMAILFAYSAALTGDPLLTPYQQYTDIYTPRHVFGFNNVVRGEQALGPKVLENYDRWAENLTPALAAQNVRNRVIWSLRWTLGIVPILFASLLWLLSSRHASPRWRLILLAIISLHVVHVPYWFEGIMGWHYVLESAPLWLLLTAEGTRQLFAISRDHGIRGARFVWLLSIITAVAANLFTLPPLWPGRLPQAIIEVRYPRAQYAAFRAEADNLRGNVPALVLVLPDPADRHMDYVTNDPALARPVLVGRIGTREEVAEIAPLFPSRKILLYDAAAKSWDVLREPITR